MEKIQIENDEGNQKIKEQIDDKNLRLNVLENNIVEIKQENKEKNQTIEIIQEKNENFNNELTIIKDELNKCKELSLPQLREDIQKIKEHNMIKT